jgi:dienelactone hydrolase
MRRTLAGEHLDDQVAAYVWLKDQPYVQAQRIAVAGNSFGGIEAVLGAAQLPYCAAIDAAGASQSWSNGREIRELMIRSATSSRAPMLLFQASNDYDTTPTNVIAERMRAAGKAAEVRFYPPFGNSTAEGHNFAWRGGKIWGSDVLSFLERHCEDADH